MNDSMMIVAAVKAYQTEYGKYPDVPKASLVGGQRSNRDLMHCLIGADDLRNPRRIVFLDRMEAKPISGWFEPKTYGAGFHPTSGDYLDPWGLPYHILLDSDYDGTIPNPYGDEPEQQIRSGVIVWSLGKDRVFGRRADHDKSSRPDDVVSWR